VLLLLPSSTAGSAGTRPFLLLGRKLLSGVAAIVPRYKVLKWLRSAPLY
jgi:hypothetical protein